MVQIHLGALMNGYIYLIASLKNEKRYLGSTNNPSQRINAHNHGKCIFTKNYCPWKCILVISVGNLNEARKIEYYIKRQKEKLTIKNIIKALDSYYQINSGE